MKITSIEAKTIPEAWFLCIRELMKPGLVTAIPKGIREYVIDRGSFEKTHIRREFDCVSIHIEYPGSRPLSPDVPTGVPSPCSDEAIEEKYLPYIMTGVKQPNEQYTYGEDIVEQIPEVVRMYREDGYNTNQAFIAVGSKESLKLKDPQCLRLIDTRISYGKLHFIVYFRSWDLWGGLPVNLGGIQILKEYMASEIGVEDGELIAFSKGLHLYDTCWDLANKVLRR